MVRALALLAALAALAGPAAARAGETRLICGFEKAEVAKWAKFRAQDEKSCTARHGGCYGCNFTATRGPATGGKWALSVTFRKSGGSWTPGVMTHWGRKLFTTSRTLARIAPTDWTVFEALEFNVRSAKPGEVGLVMALEDSVIEPPVLRRFKFPGGGKWHTVRVPVKPLGEVLALKDMVNFWVIVEQSPDRTEIRMDDLRLVKGEVRGRYPMVEDKSPVKETYEKLCAKLKGICPGERVHLPKGTVQPAPPEPGVDPRKFSRPAKTGKFSLLDITKKVRRAHTRRTFPYGLELFDDRSAIISLQPKGLLYTTDAGKTWKNLDGGEKGIRYGFGGETSWRCEVSGDRGDVLFVGLGKCCGGGLPTTLYFRRIVHTAQGWRFGPAYPVDRDTRHCQGCFDVVRLASGRIWAAWDHSPRTGGSGAHARYSDDDGVTWKAAGKTPAVPGSGRGDPKLVPFGKVVAGMWPPHRKGPVTFSTSDGKSWSKPAKLPATWLGSATSPDGKVIYAVVDGKRILRGDGKNWSVDAKLANLPSVKRGQAPAYLTSQRKIGRVHCIYAAKSGGKSRVFLTSRGKGGRWSEPRAVAGSPDGQPEEMPLIVSVPRWSPEEFVPVAVFGLRGKGEVVCAQVVKVPAGKKK